MSDVTRECLVSHDKHEKICHLSLILVLDGFVIVVMEEVFSGVFRLVRCRD